MTGTSALQVHSSNADQLRAWDGDEGAYWAEHAEYFDRSVAAYHERLLATANITTSDRVLDIGCGTGQTTRDAACAAASGAAVGVDLSARMLDVARRRAEEEGVTNVSFEQVDAQVHAFPPEGFDLAISRTGAMFFGDLTAAFTNIGHALVPGGRLVLVAWQPLPANEWIREISGALAAGRDVPAPPPDAPGPFSLSDPDRVRSILTAAGFTGIEMEPTTAGMWFGTDADDAHRFVVGLMGWMLTGLDDTGRARAVDDLRATMAAHESSDGVVFGFRRVDHQRDPGMTTVTTTPSLGSFSAVDTEPSAATLLAALDEQASIPAIQRLRATATELLGVRLGHLLVDAGCGTGDVARALAGRVGPTGTVLGIDASETMITEARRRAGTTTLPVEFRSADITNLPLDDATCDGALCERVFQHLASPHEAMAELVRITRPGGRIVVIDTDWGLHAIHGADATLTAAIVDCWASNAANGLVGRQLPALFADAGLRDPKVIAETMTSTDPQQPSAPPFAAMAAAACHAGAISAADGDAWLNQPPTPAAAATSSGQ